MKRTILIFIGLCLTMFLQAQVSKTASITAGSLSTTLTTTELSTVTNLTLTGTIDARDFKTMRDNMPLLAVIDLSNTTIATYTGTEGTAGAGSTTYPANTLPDYAFSNFGSWQGKASLTSIILPASITSIGNVAFNGCDHLTSINITSSVTSIGSYAFNSCYGMTLINIPSSVTTIGESTFRYNSGVINVDANNFYFSSSEGILFNKAKTTLIQCPLSKSGTYTIPSTVNVIGSNAFVDCNGLSSITIPASVSFIGSTAFLGCKNLIVDANNLSYSSIDGILFNKAQTSLIQCPTKKIGNYNIPSTVATIEQRAFMYSELTSVTIPPSVKTIENSAFYSSSNLTSLTIPSSVTSIKSDAFSGCIGLTSIYVSWSVPLVINLNELIFNYFSKNNCKLYVPYGTSALYAAANQWKDFTSIVEFAEFKLSTNSTTLPAAGGTANVNLATALSWTTSTDQPWLTVTQVSGTGSQTLNYTATANPSYTARVANLIVSATAMPSQTLSVTQSANNQPLTGIRTINPAGGDFASFTEAITALNSFGVGAGGVTFKVASGTTYNESELTIWTSTSSAANPINFQKDGNGTNPIIYGKKVGGTTSDAIVRIFGTDYLTFDGIDLASDPTATLDADKIETGYSFNSINVINGCSNTVIKNCRITIERKTNADNQYGINFYQSGSLATGIHSNILIDNVTFIKGRTAVFVGAGTLSNENIEIRNCKFGELASTIEPLDYTGLVYFTKAKNVNFHDNEIQNMVGPDPYAVQMMNLIGNNVIFNNKIHNLRSSSTIEDSDLFGLYVSSGDAGTTVDIYNNLIYDLDGAKGSSTAAPNPYWNLQYLVLIGYAQYHLFNNTIIGSSINQHENSMLCWTTVNTEIRNNVLADFSVTGANSNRSMLILDCLTENNLFWIDESLPNNFIFRNTYKFREWQKGSSKPSAGNYLSNVLANPNFTDRANFNFIPKNPSSASNLAQPIGLLTTDINGAARDAKTPDIGAFEGDFGPVADIFPPVIRFQPIPGNMLDIVKLTAEITDNIKVTDAKLWFREKGSVTAFVPTQGSQFGNIWEFTFPTLNPGFYEYFVCAKDAAGNVVSNGFMTTGLNAVVTGLSVNNPPANPDFAYSFANKKTVGGVEYTVGSGGNYSSLTKPGGLFEAINQSLVSGNINATIVSDLDETGEIPLKQWQESGNGNYLLTIKPGGATMLTISNATSNPISIVGADRVTIDGSFGADNQNHLKFDCNNANPLKIVNLDVNGCDNISIKYCDFSSVTYACIFVTGNYHSNFSLDHINAIKGYSGISLNFVKNASITNCIIGNSDVSKTMSNYGIYLASCSNVQVENNTIRNVINTTLNASSQGIYLSNITSGSISRNKIFNVLNNQSGGSNVSNGLVGITCTNVMISNNIISGVNGAGSSTLEYNFGIKGIVLTGCSKMMLYYNTVNLYGEGNASADAESFALSTDNSTNLEIRNNIFSNTIYSSNSASYSDLVYQKNTELSNVFSNNLYYNGGTNSNVNAFCIATNWPEFRGWQSLGYSPGNGRDINSGYGDPKYTNSSSNDFSILALSPALNSGIPVAVTTDINGNPRSATNPDMGALEDNSLTLTTDIIAPCIDYVPFPSSINTNPAFSATITDNVAVTAAKLWYRQKGSIDAFVSVEGIKQPDNKSWNFSVTSALTSGASYEYFICAKDAANNIITNGITSSALNAATVGLTNNTPAVNPVYFRSFSVADLSITMGTITGSPFFVSETQSAATEIPFTKNGVFGSGNVITAYLSDANGNFTSETAVGSIASSSLNANEGEYNSVGFRIHPTAGTYTVNTKLTFTGVNATTVHKTQVGDFTGYGLDITVTDQTMTVGGQTVYKCNLQITGMPNPADQTVFDTYNGAPMNYFNPVTKVFELYYSYNNLAPRKVRETNSMVNLGKLIGVFNNTMPAGTGYKIRVKSSQPSGIVSNSSNAFEIRKIDLTPPVVTLACAKTSPVTAPFVVSISFSEEVQSFSADRITVTNATISDFTAASLNKMYTVLITPTNTGTVTVQVDAGKVLDLVGNANPASNVISRSYIELDAPLLNISTLDGSDIVTTLTAKLKFTFSQDVTGFSANDIVVTNGSISNLVADGTYPNKIFTADLAPVISGLVKITVANDVATNASSKGNSAAELNLTYVKPPNRAPVANAGADQSVNEGVTVTLDGSASTDLDSNTLTYKWTAPAGITLSSTTVAKPTFTAPQVNVNADYTLSLVVNDGIVDSPADQVVVSVKDVPVTYHFTPVWTGNGVDHMNINIYSAKLDGVELEAGDEVGIFDGALCVGVGKLTGPISQLSTLDIAVSKNDGAGNGYTAGDAITYKLYDTSKDLEMTNVTAVYANDNPDWSIDGKFAVSVTSFAALTGVTKVTQDIAMNIGWNLISTYAIPANLDMMAVFQPLITAGTLKKVMDEAGKTIENFGAFGGWKNNIGSLNSSKGYKVNLTAAGTLSLTGLPVQLPYAISLAAGWNIISYPCSTAQDAKALVQALISSDQLKKVMDEAGKTIENFGAFGGWKNNIGNFMPGKGYKVNVLSACTLSITGPANKAAVIVPDVLASAHFAKVYTGNGTDHFNVHMVDLASSGLVAGDQIGIFDGNYCVGSATIGHDQLMSGNISIPSSFNDELNGKVNGFTVGHPVTLQLYRDNQTYPLTPAIVSGSQAFEKNGSLFVKVVASDLPVAKISVGADQVKCYPNPFVDQLTIEIRLTQPKNLEVKIYDLSGKLVRNLYKGEAGTSETLIWDGTNGNGAKMISGTYILKANEMIEKVALKK